MTFTTRLDNKLLTPYLIWKWCCHVVVSTLVAEDMTGEVGHTDLFITRPVGTPATNQNTVLVRSTNQNAPCAMTIGHIPRCHVAIVIVEVIAYLRVIITIEVGVTPLHPVINDNNLDSVARDP